MNLKFLLGVATGVGITYLLTSPRGKQWFENLGQGASDVLIKGEDLLLNASDKIESVREKIVSNTKQSVM